MLRGGRHAASFPRTGPPCKVQSCATFADQFCRRFRSSRSTWTATVSMRCTDKSRRRSASGSAPARCRPAAHCPPTRSLAAELGVTRGVVVEAYAQLVAEGYLTSRGGGYTQVSPATTAAPPTTAPPPRSTRSRAAGSDGRLRLRPRRTSLPSRAPPGCVPCAGCSPRRPTSVSATSTAAVRSSCGRRSPTTSTGCGAPTPPPRRSSSPTGTPRRSPC